MVVGSCGSSRLQFDRPLELAGQILVLEVRHAQRLGNITIAAGRCGAAARKIRRALLVAAGRWPAPTVPADLRGCRAESVIPACVRPGSRERKRPRAIAGPGVSGARRASSRWPSSVRRISARPAGPRFRSAPRGLPGMRTAPPGRTRQAPAAADVRLFAADALLEPAERAGRIADVQGLEGMVDLERAAATRDRLTSSLRLLVSSVSLPGPVTNGGQLERAFNALLAFVAREGDASSRQSISRRDTTWAPGSTRSATRFGSERSRSTGWPNSMQSTSRGARAGLHPGSQSRRPENHGSPRLPKCSCSTKPIRSTGPQLKCRRRPPLSWRQRTTLSGSRW